MCQICAVSFCLLMIQTCFFSDNDLSRLNQNINSELDKLADWFKANKLTVNLKKSNCIIFRLRQKKVGVIDLELNNVKISQVKEVMFLGIVLDEHLTWK